MIKYNLNLKKNLEEDEAEELITYSNPQHVSFFQDTQTAKRIKLLLDEYIEDAKYYRHWIHAVESLNEGDMVYISVNSYGGNLDGAIAIINAMKSTLAEVHVCIDGSAASAASLIALTAPSVSVSPYASMMIHSATFGAFGKQSNVISHASFIDKQVKSLMQDIYKDFLTESEFQEVIVGREIWLDSAEIITRLKRRAVIQQERLEAEADKEEKALELIELEELAEKPKPRSKSKK